MQGTMGTLSFGRRVASGVALGEPNMAWIPVRTAASMLGVSRQRVYQLVAKGALTGRSVDGTVLVGQRSVEARVALLLREGG